MSRAQVVEGKPRGEPRQDKDHTKALQKRVLELERLVRRVEEELSDDELDDEQKLQNIGERVAQYLDGR